MKRNWDIIREILIFAENVDMRERGLKTVVLPGRDPFDVYYNGKKVEEAGLIKAGFTIGDPPDIHITELTWEGHDFLDAVRSDTVWTKAKHEIGEHSMSAPFEVVKAVAIKILSSMLGIPT